MKTMNKIGGERVLSIYWFIMFVIVAVGLISGIVVFFSNPLDIRQAEGNILVDQVMGCFSNNGVIIEGIMERVKEVGFEAGCGLVLGEDFYVNVTIEEDSVSYGVRFAEAGVADSEKNIPSFVEREVFVLQDNKMVLIKFLVTIGKAKQNAI